MSTFIGNLNTMKYESLSASNNAGKLYVPVNKTALMYSHFEHVSGVAARAGQNGVSINRLRILNSLIERVADIKNQEPVTVKSVSESEVEKMIAAYQNEMKNAMKNTYALSGARPLPGQLFSLHV